MAHHLTMSHIAQRRDIDDPKTIESLAELCRTPERLRMLYLLTCADMRAVGPGVMTGWQAQILWDLYARTLAHLTGGQRERPTRDAVAAAGDRGDARRGAAHARWPRTWRCSPSATSPPPRPSASRPTCGSLDRLARRAVLATELFHHPDLGSSELVIATRDVPGLFSLIAGTLAAQGINILSAQIHTRADGIVIDTFQVNDPFGEAVTEEARWRRTLEALRRVLRGEAERGGAARPAPGGAPGRGGRGRAAQDLGRQPALGQPHRAWRSSAPTGSGCSTSSPARSRPRASISRARASPPRSTRPTTRSTSTDRQGRRLEDDPAMGRVRESLEDALAEAALRC